MSKDAAATDGTKNADTARGERLRRFLHSTLRVLGAFVAAVALLYFIFEV